MNDTAHLIKLVNLASETIAGGPQVRGLFEAIERKLILLQAAQEAAQEGLPLETIKDILDEH